jgi:hypothetical protein
MDREVIAICRSYHEFRLHRACELVFCKITILDTKNRVDISRKYLF